MFKYFIIFLTALAISSCSNNQVVTNPITGEKPTPGIFSKDASKGISLDQILNPQNRDGLTANVNGFLWRASLNVLSIAPLISTDALGGTIITDWYISNNIKNQRIKITAFIKTSELRSDGIDIKVHLQKRENGVWSDIMTNEKLETQIEDQILNEARILRINSLK
jgi:ribosome-associated protein YbcJ (S4-like RNA binding protein)